MQHKSHIQLDATFTYKVTGYDVKKREYILQNIVTKEEKRLPKKEVEEMMQEQQKHNEHHELKK